MLLLIYGQTVSGGPAERAAVARAFWHAFFHPDPGRRRAGLAAGAGAGKPPCGTGGNAAADGVADGGNPRRISAPTGSCRKPRTSAEAANLAKSRYVVGISHELRSPLNAILGYAQLLERDTAISAQRRDNIRIIRRSGEHLAGLIEGLLDISKIEAGRIEIYRDEVRLPEFLQQLVNMFRLQAEAKGIAFSFVHSGPAAGRGLHRRTPVAADPDQSAVERHQVHPCRVGAISASLAQRNRRDSRSPIPASVSAKPIWSASSNRSSGWKAPAHRSPPASGLGLTITRLLTQIMGGELTVTSQPNQGSCFRVRLMLSGSGTGRLKPAPLESRILGYKGERLTVLVADDDPVHRGLLEDLLSPLGFIRFHGGDGAECLDARRAMPAGPAADGHRDAGAERLGGRPAASRRTGSTSW